MDTFSHGGYYAIYNVGVPTDGFWPYLPVGKGDPWPVAEKLPNGWGPESSRKFAELSPRLNAPTLLEVLALFSIDFDASVAVDDLFGSLSGRLS